MGDLGLILGLGRSPGGGNGNHCSILVWRIPLDRGAWQATVHSVAKSQTLLSMNVCTQRATECLFLACEAIDILIFSPGKYQPEDLEPLLHFLAL